MNPRRRWVRISIAALLLLAAFSYFVTRAVTSGRWPELPPGAFRDVDLWTGLIFLAALILFLLFPQSRRPT